MPESRTPSLPGNGPAIVLGAGYAGLKVVHTIDRLARGKIPLVLVDRHPVHVLRTELYEVGQLARGTRSRRRFALPMREVLDGASVEFREGTVESIDLASRSITVDGRTTGFRALAICLGSVPAYYHVPGAVEHTHMVYRLGAAEKLGAALLDLERGSRGSKSERRPRVVVVGGGSTGTEVAAEIATVDWAKVVGAGAPVPEVTLVTGSVAFLAGLPEGLTRHARELLGAAGVRMVEGTNVTRVDERALTLEGGETIAFDLCVWAAGVQAPDVVRALPVPHGHSGRLKVAPTLEIADHPGIFGVGDVVEFEDPTSGAIAPATAQAALSEATVAGRNLVARWFGRPLRSFRYRERGTIVSVGHGVASADIRHLTIWGSPAKLLKWAEERRYQRAAEHGRPGT